MTLSPYRKSHHTPVIISNWSSMPGRTAGRGRGKGREKKSGIGKRPSPFSLGFSRIQPIFPPPPCFLYNRAAPPGEMRRGGREEKKKKRDCVAGSTGPKCVLGRTPARPLVLSIPTVDESGKEGGERKKKKKKEIIGKRNAGRRGCLFGCLAGARAASCNCGPGN